MYRHLSVCLGLIDDPPSDVLFDVLAQHPEHGAKDATDRNRSTGRQHLYREERQSDQPTWVPILLSICEEEMERRVAMSVSNIKPEDNF